MICQSCGRDFREHGTACATAQGVPTQQAARNAMTGHPLGCQCTVCLSNAVIYVPVPKEKLMMSLPPNCPKCSDVMMGPRWNSTTDSLVYQCRCGYKLSQPTHDTKHGTGEAKTLADIVARGTR